jgi:hypothetical protein
VSGVYDLRLEAGADFERTLTWVADGDAVNLTGYTARLQIRDKQTSTEPLLALTTENGGLTLGGAAGTIALVISAAGTMTLSDALLTGIYDLELIAPAGRVTRLLRGNVTIAPNVTR